MAQKDPGTQENNSAVNDYAIVDTVFGYPVLWASKNFMNANQTGALKLPMGQN